MIRLRWKGWWTVLHIKLPKNKVAKACECVAKQCSSLIAIINDQYRFDLECWRKDGKDGDPPNKPRDLFVFTEQRSRLYRMADMAKHSTGDVYVSAELWDEIKGVYDV
jgi:hypothetical protein